MSQAAPAPIARRKDPEDRRREIVKAAAALGLKEGLGRVTARRVAERIGVRSGLVMHYFSTVDALITAAFTQLADAERITLNRAMEQQPTCTAQVLTVLRAYTDSTRDEMGLLWLDAWRQAADRPMLRQAVINQMERDVETLEAAITVGVDAGEFKVDAPARAAIRILALLDGQVAASAIRTALSESSLDYPAVQEMLFATAERELGVRPGTFTS